MKILYRPGCESLKNITAVKGGLDAYAEADVVVGKDGRIIKARFGHRHAQQQIRLMAEAVAE